MCIQFFLPTAMGRIEFSTRLLDNSSSGYSEESYELVPQCQRVVGDLARSALWYLLRHWRPLTLFLRQAGAPLDNNMVRELYLTELQRHAQKLATRPAEWMPWNYRETLAERAQVGDLFMSLIHTCQLCGANSFERIVSLSDSA
jgi:hypothetical protein